MKQNDSKNQNFNVFKVNFLEKTLPFGLNQNKIPKQTLNFNKIEILFLELQPWDYSPEEYGFHQIIIP